MSEGLRASMCGAQLATPLGREVSAVVDQLLLGTFAGTDNPHYCTESYACRLAAALVGTVPKTPHDRILRRMGRYGYDCALRALQASGAPTGTGLGLFSGVGGVRAHWDEMLPALANQKHSFEDSWKRGLKRLHPFWMLQHLSNNTHALLSKAVDARGEGATYGGANAGAQALSAAIWSLHAGAIDTALVVAYDSLLEPESVVEMAARGAATTLRDVKQTAPYRECSQGFVPGEAAAAVVLRRPQKGELTAQISATTASDGNTGAPSALTLQPALLRMCGQSPPRIVDGSALGICDFDTAEQALCSEQLGDSVMFTAMQSAMGQVGAAASLVQAIVMVECLERGVVAPIAGASASQPIGLHSAQHHQEKSALCLSAGAPGLAAIVRVDMGMS